MGLRVNSSENSMLQVPEWYSCSCQELMSFRKKKRVRVSLNTDLRLCHL